MDTHGRRERSLQNTVVALLSEILVTMVGFLLPRAIISNYGSAANGLVTSLQQFIQYFTLVEGGLAGAALFALYKPLAEKKEGQVRTILYSAKKMYRVSGGIYLGILVCFAFLYPCLVAETGFSYPEVVTLFLLIGLNGATQLLFVGKYKILLNATQNNRISVAINSISTCLYSLILIVASCFRLPIVAAVAMAVSAYILRSVAYFVAARKLFPQYGYEATGEHYRFTGQKDVFIQQILSMVVLNCGTLVLSFTGRDMTELSVYNVYNMVLTAVFLVAYCVDNGVAAAFGDLIARDDLPRLQQAYREFETLFQIFWTVLISCVSVLYQPFMHIYAGGFTDAEYVRPTLCLWFSLLGGAWIIRNQQSVPVSAAGRFRQMQRGNMIEAVLTVVLSLVGLYLYGLEGLVAGRALAAVYRAVDLLWHNHRHVVKLPWHFTAVRIGGSVIVVLLMNGFAAALQRVWQVNGVIQWLVLAVGCFLTATVGAVAMAFCTDYTVMEKWRKKLLSKLR